ncbi:hypothetical protein STEG23_004228 [Scotinomys teguina]
MFASFATKGTGFSGKLAKPIINYVSNRKLRREEGHIQFTFLMVFQSRSTKSQLMLMTRAETALETPKQMSQAKEKEGHYITCGHIPGILLSSIQIDLYMYLQSYVAYINQSPTSHPQTVLRKLENITSASKWHGHSKFQAHTGRISLKSVLKSQCEVLLSLFRLCVWCPFFPLRYPVFHAITRMLDAVNIFHV